MLSKTTIDFLYYVQHYGYGQNHSIQQSAIMVVDKITILMDTFLFPWPEKTCTCKLSYITKKWYVYGIRGSF